MAVLFFPILVSRPKQIDDRFLGTFPTSTSCAGIPRPSTLVQLDELHRSTKSSSFSSTCTIHINSLIWLQIDDHGILTDVLVSSNCQPPPNDRYPKKTT